jgi:hypothetical protein
MMVAREHGILSHVSFWQMMFVQFMKSGHLAAAVSGHKENVQPVVLRK